MKILILTSTLSFGGAERTAANLSLALSANHQVTVVAFHGHVTYPYGGKLIDCGFPYDPRQGLIGKPLRLFLKSRALRQVLIREQPEVVLSFAEGQNLVSLLSRDDHRRYVINSQNPPSFDYAGLNKLLYSAFIRKMYPKADCAIALSKGVKADLVHNFRLPPHKVRVIYNPVDCAQVQSEAKEAVSEPLFSSGLPIVLNVGRLVEQKNQSLLIRAFARVRQHVPSKLVFLGEGPLESDLRLLASDLGVEKDVHFLGWRANPFKYMRRARLFALSSDFEGFGNVLVEAMTCGCPVISTDCPYGPGEVLDGGKYGLLVPKGDEAALAEGMASILTNEDLRVRFAHAGTQRAKDFDLTVIAGDYENVFASL